MTLMKTYLKKSAKALAPPPAPAAAEFEVMRDRLAEEHNLRMAARPDLDRLIGTGNKAMMEDNSRNFCRFMSAMFSAYEPEVMIETVLWVFRSYRAHGFQTAYWPAHLDMFVELMRERLTPTAFVALYPFLNWLIINIPAFVALTDRPAPGPTGKEPSHDR